MNKKRLIAIFLIIAMVIGTISIILFKNEISKEVETAEKPVIYVYNSTGKKDVAIGIEKPHGDYLDLTYPKAIKNYWKVTADETGKLLIGNKKYNYLYWEDSAPFPFNIDKGFCIRGEDTAQFLENALTELGLNEYERNDFITYWLPQMANNKYNLISFNPPEYEEYYKLNSKPKADNTIRVFMMFIKTNEYENVQPQNLSAFNNCDRNGLTIVEWGGINFNK